MFVADWRHALPSIRPSILLLLLSVAAGGSSTAAAAIGCIYSLLPAHAQDCDCLHMHRYVAVYACAKPSPPPSTWHGVGGPTGDDDDSDMCGHVLPVGRPWMYCAMRDVKDMGQQMGFAA